MSIMYVYYITSLLIHIVAQIYLFLYILLDLFLDIFKLMMMFVVNLMSFQAIT